MLIYSILFQFLSFLFYSILFLNEIGPFFYLQCVCSGLFQLYNWLVIFVPLVPMVLPFLPFAPIALPMVPLAIKLVQMVHMLPIIGTTGEP